MKKLLSLMCSLLMIVTLCGCSSTQDQQEEVTLTFAAAASLENTFEDKLIPEFEKENPNIKVQGVYDSSGKLQIQIEQGLKADVFFSAATKQMDTLVDEKYINKKDVVDLLENKLVLITGKQTTTEVKDFANIAKAETIAIGDPEVVPAGQYAKMALTHLGLYDALSSKYSLTLISFLSFIGQELPSTMYRISISFLDTSISNSAAIAALRLENEIESPTTISSIL